MAAQRSDTVNGIEKKSSRTAIEVSYDENFDDIYNRRFRKYCLLLAKEKELLRRLGKVRLRSSSFHQQENGQAPPPLSKENDKNTEDKPLQKRPLLSDGRRASSLKDMRHLMPPNLSLTSFRRLSTSYEGISELEFTEILADNEKTKPQSRHASTITRRKGPSMLHSHSCEGISFTDSVKNVSISTTQSFDNIEVCHMLAGMSTPEGNGLYHYDKESQKTSSTRDLTDRNVRDVVKESKTLRSSSPSLERRLAQARLKALKRDETMRSLDHDFTKAREIINMYKSTESLNGLSTDEEEDNRRSWSK